jgi:hypothetical protein
MNILSACGQCITPQLARTAIVGTGEKPELLRMHPAQVCMIAQLYETFAIYETAKEVPSQEIIEAVHRLAKEYAPVTFMGIKIQQDAAMPEHWIEFLNDKGELIARIESLAIPVEMMR